MVRSMLHYLRLPLLNRSRSCSRFFVSGSIPQAEGEPAATPTPSLRSACIAELFGTAGLVFVGCGGLCVNLYLGGLTGMWQVASLWILGAVLAVYSTGAASGGHINPAVTLAFALVRPRDFNAKKVIFYWIAQLLGAMLAGTMNLIVFHTAISRYEKKSGLTRGDLDSIQSAAAFGDYYRYEYCQNKLV